MCKNKYCRKKEKGNNLSIYNRLYQLINCMLSIQWKLSRAIKNVNVDESL